VTAELLKAPPTALEGAEAVAVQTLTVYYEAKHWEASFPGQRGW